MTVKRLFNDRHWFPDVSGNNALSGGKLFVYLAGTSTKATTYNSSAGSVQNSNPLVLDSAGKLQSEVWVATGATYKLFLGLSTETDPPTGTNLCNEDNISPINDVTTTVSEWVASGLTPTYVSASSFTFTGDQTATFQAGRRLKIIDAGGTKYASILTSVFGAVTTITVLVDAAGSLSNPLTSVAYGLLSVTNPSIPYFIVQNIYPISTAPNPFFMIDQRFNSATSRADDTYASDRWYVLTQTNPITVTTQTDQENGQPFNARLTQSNAAAQRCGYASIIEGKDCKNLRGQQMTFRPKVRISNSQAVRIAVLEWTGTEDVVTSDVVLDWTSSTYTANNFFLAANLTISGVSAKTPSAATWTDMDALTVTLGSSFNNLILFVWTEATAAQNVTLDIGKVRFVQGTYAGEIASVQFAQELAKYQRYYWKTFNYNIQPATFTGQIDGGIKYEVTNAGINRYAITIRYPQTMRASPTMTFFNTDAANNKWRNFTRTADSSTPSQLGPPGTGAFTIENTQQAGDQLGDEIRVQATAEAEL